MNGFILFLFSLLSTGLYAASETIPEDELIGKKVHAHMIIGDHQSACSAAYAGLSRYPSSKTLWHVYLRALAKAGDEKALLSNWRFFVDKFPEEKIDREVLEFLAWAAIDKGAGSSSPGIRVFAMLGAFFSQDAKGVAILRNSLSDGNSFLRAAALKLCSNLPDASLQEEVFRRFKTENVWSVKLEAIKAVGKLRIEKARSDLIALIADGSSSLEEKAAAIEALVEMSEGIERAQIQQFVQGDRSGMRMLACELVAYFEQGEDADLLLPLVHDHHPEVRAKALQTFGWLRIPDVAGRPIVEVAASSIADPDPQVVVTAAWLLTINDQNSGRAAFERLIASGTQEVRRLAAGALASTGRYGVDSAVKLFNSSSDPYVRMNLAIGMIGQQAQIMEACDCLFNVLSQQNDRLMWQEDGNFRILAPSKVKHDDSVPNYPEAVNQLVRLDILEMLAIVHYPKAQQAIKNFLQDRTWGISGMASALLLTEGDEDAVDLVKVLLNERDAKVRIQAALILSLWGKGEDAVNVLQDGYACADKELKGQILEGIGRVGSAASFAFLVDKLQEPYQTLRIISAAALLECLYH